LENPPERNPTPVNGGVSRKIMNERSFFIVYLNRFFYGSGRWPGVLCPVSGGRIASSGQDVAAVNSRHPGNQDMTKIRALRERIMLRVSEKTNDADMA
jgi:hypothetical protein